MIEINVNWPQLGYNKFTIKEIGRKSYYLNQLIRHSFTVPDGYVITNDLFWEILTYNGVLSKFKTLLNEPRMLAWDQIEDLVKQLTFPSKLNSNLLDIANKIRWPIAVRSSAVDEDGELTSKAGIYKSITGCMNLPALIEAIKSCWISSFTILAQSFGAGNEPIPLIIQHSITPDFSGVSFSVDPTTGNNSVVVVCATADGGNGIVSGESSGSTISFLKNNLEAIANNGNQNIDISIAQKVAELTLLIEKKLNFQAVDVEWASIGDDIIILQARPTTGMFSLNNEVLPKFCDLESQDCLSIPIDKLQELHDRWLANKFYFRKKSKEFGLRIPYAGYLRYDPNNISFESISKILENYKTSYLILDRSIEERSMIIKRDELYAFLKLQLPSSDGLITIRIRELPSFDMSGHSTVLEDGKILIEVIPGTFNSLFMMHLVPGIYIIDTSGRIINSVIKSYSRCSRIDSATLQFIEPEESNLTSELSSELISQICTITNKVNKYIKEARLEWTIENNELFLFDFSVEHQPLNLSSNNTTILSKGNFEGTTFLLEDTNKLRSICNIHTISVLPDSDFYKVQNSNEVQELIAVFNRNSDKPVIVAKQPIAELALIAKYARAFIFEEGSILCHLGIILRELGIPAIFMEGALSKLNNNNKILCVDGKISILD
jgi:rifampicin phosphotransferase